MCCCPRTSDCSRLQFKRSWLRWTPLLQLFATPMRHIAVSAAVAVGLVICVQTSSRPGAATWEPRGVQQPRGGSRRRNRSLSSWLPAMHINRTCTWTPMSSGRLLYGPRARFVDASKHRCQQFTRRLAIYSYCLWPQQAEGTGQRPKRQQGNKATGQQFGRSQRTYNHISMVGILVTWLCCKSFCSLYSINVTCLPFFL